MRECVSERKRVCVGQSEREVEFEQKVMYQMQCTYNIVQLQNTKASKTHTTLTNYSDYVMLPVKQEYSMSVVQSLD